MELRTKMATSDRAKQFMPFAALKGLDKALEMAELNYFRVEKPVLSEDTIEELNSQLNRLERYDIAYIRHYMDGRIINTAGTVTWIDGTFKYLLLNDKRIEFENILKIDIE